MRPQCRVKHPDWLHKRVRERDSKSQQLTLDAMFAGQREKQAKAKVAAAEEAKAKGGMVGDIEDLMGGRKTDGECGGWVYLMRLRDVASLVGSGQQVLWNIFALLINTHSRTPHTTLNTRRRHHSPRPPSPHPRHRGRQRRPAAAGRRTGRGRPDRGQRSRSGSRRGRCREAAAAGDVGG